MAAFVCPGHPLLDATIDLFLERDRDLLRRGAVLVDERDAVITHLYGLTDEEFAYILTTFPLVSTDIKTATLEAFRTIEDWNEH